MKVKRMIKSDVETFQVGDIIKVKLKDGKKAQAMAVKEEADGMVFCFVNCLAEEYSMNDEDTNEGGYDESNLRIVLNSEILDKFPDKLKAVMVPFDNGDLLRIPTEKEIFGENYYGEYEDAEVKQWEPMKWRRNRMAFQGKNGVLEWYWLQNKRRESAAYFACVYDNGNAASTPLLTLLACAPLSKSKILNLHHFMWCNGGQT